MSRIERKFTAAEEASLDPGELSSAFEGDRPKAGSARSEAFARYLAAGEGWREALLLLGGAFANRGEVARSTGGKEE